MNQFKKSNTVKVTVKAIILLFVLQFMQGCITTNSKPVYKTLALTKVMAYEIAVQAKQMNKIGLLSAEKLERVREAYEKARTANDVVIDAVIVAIDLGVAPDTDPDYLSAIIHLNKFLQDLSELANQNGLIIVEE